MTYPSKKCVSNKKMVAGLANNFFKKKQHIVKTKKKKINITSTKNNKHTYLIRRLPIKSDLISRGKQCHSNNTEIDTFPNHVL